jgi:hypothetical protein
LVGVELATKAAVVHVSDAAEDRPWLPRSVVFAEAPSDARVAVRVPPVELILVIEIEGCPKRF